jgi:type II secretory pathway component PulF
VDRLLLNVSTFLDEENEVIVRSLTSIMEPIILIFMGILVGLIAICMFMPLFDLTSMTQGGG